MADKGLAKWQQDARKELKDHSDSLVQFSPEGVAIKRLYSEQDLVQRNYRESFPAQSPYLRGVRATMYTNKPWTIRQYAGFSTAADTNIFFKNCLANGQKGLSVAFDLPTHRGYDSDHPRALADVGKAGVAIDTIEDMKALFDGIALDKISVSMTMNGAVLPIMAFFIVTAQEQGCKLADLKGTIQNDILKEYIVRNTYIFPPGPSMRIVGDVISYAAKNLPLFNSVSISGYHMQEAGADSALELAYTIANGREYIKAALSKGMEIDDFAPRLSFFFAIGMNFFMEIAKLRAARKLWHEVVSSFAAKKAKSFMLRTHCQTSGYSLSESEPYNNIVRTTIEAMAATLGGTQSLHTNALDEAIALPSEFSAKIARNTQLILQHETDLTQTVDPFGGSYFIESLTDDLIKKAKELIAEIDSYGGMTEAIEKGIPKMRIEESATKKQARIDSKKDIIVGVNHFCSQEQEQQPQIRIIDNQRVLDEQKIKLQNNKKSRSAINVRKSLEHLKSVAKSGQGNLLAACVEAAKARASLGEMVGVLESVFTRYKAFIPITSSVYSKSMEEDKDFKKAKKLLLDFIEETGRRPRILVAKLGQDGHDRGARVIASGLADVGFDVDLGPLFQSPQEVVKQAVESDVHVIGISSQAAAHTTLVPHLLEHLKQIKVDDIRVVVGGIIPDVDVVKLEKSGVAAVFKPGTSVSKCAIEILKVISNGK
jgi:methylmalonyl-CoA mutase